MEGKLWQETRPISQRTEEGTRLLQTITSLTQGETFAISHLANAASLLWHSLPGINWAGFYLRQGDELRLGPFMGRPACLRIPLGRGVCGTAAALGQVQRVPDVHAFPGHIACDCASNSEIVIPIYKDQALYGVLDIDSPKLSRFSKEDEEGLLQFVHVLENYL